MGGCAAVLAADHGSNPNEFVLSSGRCDVDSLRTIDDIESQDHA